MDKKTTFGKLAIGSIIKLKLLFYIMLFATAAGARSLAPAHSPKPLLFKGKDGGVKARQLMFMENAGQVKDQDGYDRKDIQFAIAGGNGLNIFIGNGAIHYQFSRAINGDHVIDRYEHSSQQYSYCRMDVELVGANPHARVETSDKQQYYERHITSETGSEGTLSHAYGRVIYKNIYPEIDWVLYMQEGKLKHEFIVHKGGNVSDIQLKYGGADRLIVNHDGTLTASTSQGVITEQKPRSFTTDGKTINSSFQITNNTISYEVGAYAGELVIDPTLIWSTYYGGTSTDAFFSMVRDNASHLYICGQTYSNSGIVTSGAYQQTLGSDNDGVLAKYDTAGQLLWATYFGGNGYDGAYSIAIDKSGNAFITGQMISTGFATPGANQTTFGGGTGDSYLAKFSASGNLQWSTYIGGSGSDVGAGVATDAAGNVYASGFTSSTSGISTPGAQQTTYGGGGNDGYVAKYTSSGTLLWRTYYGGSGDDGIYAVATDTVGTLYITGYTASGSGIATSGSYQTSFGGGNDGFIAKLSNAGTLQWGTYYGGSGNDKGMSLAIDTMKNIYMTGQATSTTGIATPGTYSQTWVGSSDAFLVKFDSAGNRAWGTYYGGNSIENAYGVGVDNAGSAYIVGQTASGNMATADGLHTTSAGSYDAYFAKFSCNTGTLDWATYFGGSSIDMSYSVVADTTGNVFFLGNTFSSDGIATPGARQTTYQGQEEGFLAKFHFCTPPTLNVSSNTSVCAGGATPLTASGTADTYTWTPATGLTDMAGISANTGTSLLATPTQTTTYSVTGTANGCSSVATVTVTVKPSPAVNPIPDITKCSGTASGAITFASSTPGTTYAWSNSNTSIGLGGSGTGDITSFNTTNATTAPISGIITVTPSADGCAGTPASFTITVNPVPTILAFVPSQTYCNAEATIVTTVLLSMPMATFLWSHTNTQVGIGANGTGDIPSFTATNTGSSNISSFFTAVPTFTNNGVTCQSSGTNWQVTVKPFAATLDASALENTMCSGNTTTLSATGTGLTSYTWKPTATVSPATGTAVTASPTANTVYTVTGTAANGCTRTATTSIIVNQKPTVNAVANITVCPGSTVAQILSGPISGTDFNWTNANTTIGLGSSGAGNISFAATNSTNAPITAIINVTPVANGCTGSVRTFSITVNPRPESTQILPGLVYCNGDVTPPVNFVSSVPGAVFNWSNSNTAIGIGGSGSGSVPSFTILNNGSTPVTATFGGAPTYTNNSVSCTGSTVFWNVTVNPTPQAVSVSGSGTYCGTGTLTATGGIGGTIYYQGITSAGTSTLTASITEAINASGTYYFRARTSLGCWGSEGSAAVTSNAVPVPVTVSGGGLFCGNATVTASGGSGGVIYFQGTTSGSTSTVTPSSSQVLNTSGTYYFRSRSAQGCWGTEGSVTLTTSPNPDAVILTGSGTFCGGTTVTATGGSGGTIYFQGANPGGTSTAIPSASQLVTASGTYYFRSHSALGCWSDDASVTVTVHPRPVIQTFTGGGGFCIGTTGVSIGLTLTEPGVSYQLFSGVVPQSSLIAGTGAPVTFGTAYNAPGYYYAIATNAVTSCTSTLAGVTVHIDTLPAVFNVTGGGHYCNNGTGVPVGLNGSTTGVNYQLYDGGLPVGTMTPGTGSALDFGLQTVTGTYSVTAINPSTHCINDMLDSAAVALYPSPIAYNLTGGGIYCLGGTPVIMGLGNSESGTGYQLYYNTAAVGAAVAGTGSSIDLGTYILPGMYTVVATNTVTTCAAGMSDTASIIVSTPPAAYLVSGGGRYCIGDPGLQILLGGSATGINYELVLNGTTSVSVLPGSGSTLSYGPFTDTGIYTIVATDTASGCTSAMTGIGAITALPVVVPSVALSTGLGTGNAVCMGSPIMFTAQTLNGGNAPTYEWKVNNLSLSISDSSYNYIPVDGDIVWVRVSSSDQCAKPVTAMDTMIIDVDTLAVPSVFISASTTNFISTGEYDTLTAITTDCGPTPQYQWFRNGAMIPGATSVTYVSNTFANGDSLSCRVISSGGCGGIETYNSLVLRVFGVGVGTTGTQAGNVKIYPNPNQGIFTINGSFGTGDEEVFISITNALEQVVFSRSATAQNGLINEPVQISGKVANGIYLLNLRSASAQSVFKFIITQ